jgi:uncharacterized protein DUF3106
MRCGLKMPGWLDTFFLARPKAGRHAAAGVFRKREGNGQMIRRIVMAASLAALMAFGWRAYAELPAGEPSNAAERAYVQRYHDVWSNLNHEQREKVLANFRRWRHMTPRQRQRAELNLDEFSRLPPQERSKVIDAMRQYRHLPPQRRAQIQQGYNHFRKLPSGERQELLDRYRYFQQLTPQEREELLANYQQWQQMSPAQRGELKRMWHKNGGPHGQQAAPPAGVTPGTPGAQQSAQRQGP